MALKPPPPPTVKTLACRGCGASLELRAPGRSVSIACGGCGAVLDAQDPEAHIIARYESQRAAAQPKIPLGTRGRLKGEPWEVIGFAVRRTKISGISYSWFEHLLHNPTLGFRWLVEYAGHWTLSKTVSAAPLALEGLSASYLGERYRHFQTATAEVAYVVGEFPWTARVGDKATVEDYVNPPLILSREKTDAETTWSIGEYIEGDTVWKGFNLKDSPPDRLGVGAAQPSPFKPQSRSMLHLLLAFLALAVLVHVAFALGGQRKLVLDVSASYQPQKPETQTLVTEPFTLTGRRSNVMVELSTNVANNWAYFHLALVNEDTGASQSFAREVSYYFGSDSDGSWSEGAAWDRVYLSSVPSGRYTLVVEPEGQKAVTYRVRLTRDVARGLWTWVALGVLVVPALFFWWRQYAFEHSRWSESDHPMSSSSDDDDDDE